VTGSVQGIGLAIAQALASAGARIAVHGLASKGEAENVCEGLREAGAREARFFEGDLRKPGEIEALALWLCAPVAHNVTGTVIPIDGGWTAQ